MFGNNYVQNMEGVIYIMLIYIKDFFYKLCEHYGGLIGNYGWRKRWSDRNNSSGYIMRRKKK